MGYSNAQIPIGDGSLSPVTDAEEVRAGTGWLRAQAFAARARVLHPASREATEEDLPVRPDGRSQTGARVFHGHFGVPWRDVRSTEGAWDEPPLEGSLPAAEAEVLCQILKDFTTTPDDCWGAVWVGYGALFGWRDERRYPQFVYELEEMLVTRGPLAAMGPPPGQAPPNGFPEDHFRSPGLWWPADHAWCVRTGYEFTETYVSGDEALVARIVADDRLEAVTP